MPRSVWKGKIRIGRMEVGVDLFSARDSSARPGLKQIHEPSMKPVSYEKVVPGIGPVSDDEVVRGFEIGKDEYVLLRDEDLEGIAIESQKVVVLDTFVPPEDVGRLLHDKPYYVHPATGSDHLGYRVIRDGLRASGRIGVGRLTIRGRENPVVVRPLANGLLLETLIHDDEIRTPEPYFDDVVIDPAPNEAVDLAHRVIMGRAGPFEHHRYGDRYRDELKKVVEAKRAAHAPIVRTHRAWDEPATAPEDLLDALRRSLDG